MSTVYLETSFFSACVSTRTDAASIWRRAESRSWWTLQRKLHDLFVSAEVLAELSSPAYPNRDLAMKMTALVAVLEATPEVVGLAQVLVRERVMPGPAEAGDAVHVAAATVHRMDVMLTWNQKHLANLNKVRHLQAVCVRAGYVPPAMVTPDQFWADDATGG